MALQQMDSIIMEVISSSSSLFFRYLCCFQRILLAADGVCILIEIDFSATLMKSVCADNIKQ